MADEINKEVFTNLDELLSSTDLKDVTADSTGFEDLPDGYYLCEVKNTELTTSKSSGLPMAKLELVVIEDGTNVVVDEAGNTTNVKIPHTKKRHIFKYYVFKDNAGVKRFVTDMLKFEGDVEGESLLPKEAFMNSETLEDSLTAIISYNIYVKSSKSINKTTNEESTWINLISWKIASGLELPM